MSTIPEKQKALYLQSKQGSFAVGTNDVPTLQNSKQLLIKIKATSLNPVDWKIQKYGVFIENFPAVLGTDVAGEVVTIGKDVTKFKKGDRVVCQGKMDNESGSFQQYVLADEHHLSKIPSNVTYDQASTLPVALTCAYIGLYNVKPHGIGLANPVDPSKEGKYKGKPFVVFGGATSVGQFVIQFAKLSGFSPIITTASPKHTDYLKSIGATNVLDRNLSTSSLKTEINKITSEPVKYAYDTVASPETQQTAVDVLAPGGHLILVLPSAITPPPSDKEIVSALGIRQLPHNVEIMSALYGRLEEWLENGTIKPTKVDVLPNGLAGIVDGLKRLELNQVSGFKLVARPEETP